MLLLPEIHGRLEIRAEPERFFAALGRRVASGLLTGKRHSRSNYKVVTADERRMSIRAADTWSAINVGLNNLDFEAPGHGVLRYRVRYWRWTIYSVALGALLGVIGIALALLFDVRGYLTQTPGRMLPGLTVEQNVFLLWLFILFWGFVWPWLLVALHKRPLHALVRRLVEAVDDSIVSR